MQGENITNVDQKEIQVLVGNAICTIQSAVSTMIICLAPLRQTPVLENVTVSTVLLSIQTIYYSLYTGYVWEIS